MTREIEVMHKKDQSEARLTVTSGGPLRGMEFGLRRGNQVLGRSQDADVVVPHKNLSQRHAFLAWDGSEAAIADAGSTNGTLVNGREVYGTMRVRPGDVVALGGLELRLDTGAPDRTATHSVAAGTPRWHNDFRGLHHGDVNQALRDVNHLSRSWHEHRHGEEAPLDELFVGRGVGRALMALGLVLALAGFAVWMWLILGTDIGAPSTANPFELEVRGVPVGPAAFGVFATGAVLASIGGAMSRGAREKERRREYLSQMKQRG